MHKMKSSLQSTAFILITALLISGCNNDQSGSEKISNKTYPSVAAALKAIEAIEDADNRKTTTEQLWEAIKDTAVIPYTTADTAIFLYKGSANSVSWNGDFNSWGNDKSFSNTGKNIDSTDLWYLIKTFPEDARLDYKVTLNNSQWILDPNNPNQQWSGFGPNSELRMPDWNEESVGYHNENVAEGVVDSFTIESSILNYKVAYKVYKPAGYENFNDLPVLYVTDGQEYGDEKLGNIFTITNNLIAENKIDPIIMVLIDPRNPDNIGQNRRMEEYTLNNSYLNFVAEELISEIDASYKSSTEQRAILGTSLGGLNASYFGAERPDLFPMVAAQSPAYWYKTEIYNKVENADLGNQRIFISAGTFNDGLDNAKKMRQTYENKQLAPNFLIVNEGHSWGAWTQQLDNILIQFFGKS
jgi:enterochelin esterase family protein